LVGINGRLDTLQAAVILAKLEVFDAEIAARSRIAGRYSEMLQDLVPTPWIAPDRTSAYAQYTIQVDDRAAFQAAMETAGIPTAVHYPIPLHLQPVSRSGRTPPSLPHAEAAAGGWSACQCMRT